MYNMYVSLDFETCLIGTEYICTCIIQNVTNVNLEIRTIGTALIWNVTRRTICVAAVLTRLCG